MFFVVSKILAVFTEIGTDLILLIVLGLVLADVFRLRWGRALAWLGLLGLAALALLPVDTWLAGPLESRFHRPPDFPPHVDGIIVLGGAIDTELTQRHGVPALDDAAERMTTFVALARRYPDARLVFTGGSAALFGGPPEADGATQLFAALGLDTSRIVVERDSRDTYENAVNSWRMVSPRPGEQWILVTSAVHMPRSVGVFRKAGWTVIPWPVGYKTGIWRAGALPLALRTVDSAVHEWIGLVAYWVVGRSDALFPAP